MGNAKEESEGFNTRLFLRAFSGGVIMKNTFSLSRFLFLSLKSAVEWIRMGLTT